MEREKERQAESGRSFCQGCSGGLQGGLKVHRDKGRVQGPEGGERSGGAWASSRWRGIPQKRPLELHREGEKEQERKREGESAAAQQEAQDKQRGSQGGCGCATTSSLQGAAKPLARVQQHPKGCLWALPGCSGMGFRVPAITHPRKLCHPHWAQSPGRSACCCGSGTRRRC